eukprot:scaffold80155_cov18-Tisochrysis_lutea.AAC.1
MGDRELGFFPGTAVGSAYKALRRLSSLSFLYTLHWRVFNARQLRRCLLTWPHFCLFQAQHASHLGVVEGGIEFSCVHRCLAGISMACSGGWFAAHFHSAMSSLKSFDYTSEAGAKAAPVCFVSSYHHQQGNRLISADQQGTHTAQ